MNPEEEMQRLNEVVVQMVRATLQADGLNILAGLAAAPGQAAAAAAEQNRNQINAAAAANALAANNRQFGFEPLARIDALGRVPDIVNNIPPFSGRRSDFFSWCENVERVMHLYQNFIATPEYIGIINAIRNKVVGDANSFLVTQRTPLVWEDIKKALTTRYSDVRDYNTLQFQLMSLKQNNKSYEQFYNDITHILFLIKNKIAEGNETPENFARVAKVYEDMAMEVFLRGVDESMSGFLETKGPSDLNQAYEFCRNRSSRQISLYNRNGGHDTAAHSAYNSRYDTPRPYNGYARYDAPRYDTQRYGTPRYDAPRFETSRPGASRSDTPRFSGPQYNRAVENTPRAQFQGGYTPQSNQNAGYVSNTTEHGNNQRNNTGQMNSFSRNPNQNNGQTRNPFSRNQFGHNAASDRNLSRNNSDRANISRSSSMEPMEIDNTQYGRNSNRSRQQHFGLNHQSDMENNYTEYDSRENYDDNFLG